MLKLLKSQIAVSLVALMASTTASAALPFCPKTEYWHNCFGTRNVGYEGRYVGEFKDNKFHGQGTYFFSDGKYIGEFKNEKYNGQGTYTGVNGDKYKGEFKANKYNGQGTFTGADGSTKEGVWKDGEFLYANKLPRPVTNVPTPGKLNPPTKPPTQTEVDKIVSASSGSGFAVSQEGHVITNYHVIEGCEKVVVHTKGREIPITVLAYDPQNDIALLKGDFAPSTVFSISSKQPELLEEIYVAGYPFGFNISSSVKVTKGIISSLTGVGNNFSNIQIDAALQGGNSGGPILDDFGNVVGVAVAKLDTKYALENFGAIPENTNFGIKASVVRNVMSSNGVPPVAANKDEISTSQLGKLISNGTFYVSCWMTVAQIEKMRTKKVLFEELK